MKFILGKKIAMTQIFKEDGDVVPVTSVLADPNIVTQIKSEGGKDGYSGVQVGFSATKKLKKPQAGHLKDLDFKKHLREFRVDETSLGNLKRGDVISVAVFLKGDPVEVTGFSKGRGFQGVVKRHGFHGSPKTHGHKDQLRMPGSIGATDPARVFKGIRMPGQMGNAQITVKGLEIVDVDVEKNILYIKGGLPGARNGLLLISGPGEMKIEAKPVEPVAVSNNENEVKSDVAEAPQAVEEKNETVVADNSVANDAVSKDQVVDKEVTKESTEVKKS